MAVNETIVTGRVHRVLVDKATKLWQKLSFWTKASDVEFNDGKSAEEKFGGYSFYPDELTMNEYNALSAEIKATPKMIFIIKK